MEALIFLLAQVGESLPEVVESVTNLAKTEGDITISKGLFYAVIFALVLMGRGLLRMATLKVQRRVNGSKVAGNSGSSDEIRILLNKILTELAVIRETQTVGLRDIKGMVSNLGR